MTTPAEIRSHLWSVEKNLDGHVQWILGVARSSPPGGSKEWDKVLAHYGETHEPPLQRLEQLQLLGQSRGATIAEVRRAIAAMCRQAEAELDRVVPRQQLHHGGFMLAAGAGTNDPQLEAEVAGFRAKLAGLAENWAARYQGEVCDQKKAAAASVGSVFANAMATAKETPWANVKIDAAKVRECPSCGAPQEVVLDFKCRYCKAQMV
jgi:hypothetical protein